MFTIKVGFIKKVHRDVRRLLGYTFSLVRLLANQNLSFCESYRNILSWSSSSIGEKELSREIFHLLIERSSENEQAYKFSQKFRWRL